MKYKFCLESSRGGNPDRVPVRREGSGQSPVEASEKDVHEESLPEVSPDLQTSIWSCEKSFDMDLIQVKFR